MVGAGQAGTFGGTPYAPAGAGVDGTGADVLTQDIGTYAKVAPEAGGSGIQGFLTKPIIPYGPPPVEGASAMDKYLYESRKFATPSYGSLAGGVSPYEQQVFGEPLSAFGTKISDFGTKIRGSIGSDFKLPDWKMPKLRLSDWLQSQQTQTYSSPFYSSGGDVLPPHGRGYK